MIPTKTNALVCKLLQLSVVLMLIALPVAA